MNANSFSDLSDLSAAIPSSDQPTHFKSIFISDVHLGTKGCQAERLVAFLKAHRCDKLYLVGDIIDGWRMRSGVYWPQAHSDVLRRILTLTKQGTQVVYVAGNHDEFLRKYADLAIGNLKVVREAIHITEDGQRLLVVHGDQFDVVTRYHRWVAFLGDHGYSLLLGLNSYVNAFRNRFGYGYWSLSQWLKYKVKRAVNFISDFEQAVIFRCEQRGFDGVVCGHIHHAEISDYAGTTYMNCGDWVESCTALVEGADGQFDIIHWPVAEAGADNLVAFPARQRGSSAAA